MISYGVFYILGWGDFMVCYLVGVSVLVMVGLE